MRSVIRVGVTLFVVVLAIIAAILLWRFYMLSPWTRDARVRADIVTIAPDVAGWVIELKVKDNQQVNEGDILMTIDKDRYQAAYDQAKAIAETKKQQMYLKQHEAKRRRILGSKAISAELLENAQIEAAIAKGEYDQSLAQLELAKLNLDRSIVKAPRSGQITNLQLVQGNYIKEGQAAMAIVVKDSLYIQAYLEETKLPGVQAGMPVAIRLMSGSKLLKGRVEGISRGITDRNATPDGQLLADVEPTYNWVRLAQRIPVRIEFDEIPEDIHLAAGMTASVRIGEPRFADLFILW
ncbi:efflux RND transporter periplasmic adaptor subunit [Entomomonas sp. E2T0]|uniref:efflux RND transporter periplasmic adaptor subunit n=1 Tax=Entomomonas sp. E2T0 TaxID=2930213 RepID=UPI0022283004|nr:efflux RND transporter periplasmic adaptor subunit [Entomomonas sp. E2T0]UYZ83692.1 efflux RND transporter periplasmic adaptor subunit [Entomomonas sp. E2T0]